MVGADNPRPLYTPILQGLEGGKKVGDVFLIFGLDALAPRLRSIHNKASSVPRQGGTHVIPNIKPLRMPPLVGCRQTHVWVTPRPGMTQMDAGTSHRRVHIFSPNLPLR